MLPAVQVGAVQMRSKVTKAEENPVAKKWSSFSKKDARNDVYKKTQSKAIRDAAIKACIVKKMQGDKHRKSSQQSRVSKMIQSRSIKNAGHKVRTVEGKKVQDAGQAALKARTNDKEEEKKAKKAKIASSGPITARNLFVQKTMKGTKLTLKDVSTKWAALSTQQRGVLEAEAAKNKAKRTAIRESLKKPPSKYALFVKKHFTAEYTAALKSGLPRKEAFATATRAVAKKYRSQ